MGAGPRLYTHVSPFTSYISEWRLMLLRFSHHFSRRDHPWGTILEIVHGKLQASKLEGASYAITHIMGKRERDIQRTGSCMQIKSIIIIISSSWRMDDRSGSSFLLDLDPRNDDRGNSMQTFHRIIFQVCFLFWKKKYHPEEQGSCFSFQSRMKYRVRSVFFFYFSQLVQISTPDGGPVLICIGRHTGGENL